MKTMRFLSFVVFATAMLAFFACSGNDEPNNEPSSSSSNEQSSESNGKYGVCYIDVSDSYGPDHYYCYDYNDPSKYLQGCLLMSGGVAREECPQGYAKKCEEFSYNGNNYEFIGYKYRYGENFADYECENEQKAYCINEQTGCHENTGVCGNSEIATNISCNEVKFCYMEFFSGYRCFLIDGGNKDNFYKSEQDCLDDDPENEVYTQEQCIDAEANFSFSYE